MTVMILRTIYRGDFQVSLVVVKVKFRMPNLQKCTLYYLEYDVFEVGLRMEMKN